jgi:phosphonopyruvate decarboxylase
MGHCSQIAMAIAAAKPGRQVLCLDGDGALIMHMGALAIMGSRALENLKHIVLNNGAHESVGGQPTVGNEIDIPGIARACGYRSTRCIALKEEIGAAVTVLMREPGPSLLEIKIGIGAREDLGRPTRTPLENKQDFMEFLDD